jgi:hypothetical protein
MSVTRFVISRREELSGWPYDRVDGVLHVAVGPTNAANAPIVDLDRAPRDAPGLVHFAADLTLLRPLDGGSGRLLVDVVNRGRRTALKSLNRAAGEAEPKPEIDPGDGFLMRGGWTIAFCAWQWDVIPSSSLLGLDAPHALGPDGQPIQGQVCVQFQPNAPSRQQLLADRVHRPYTAADLEDPSATLTVRDWQDGPRTTIARERWRFARDENAGPVADASHVWLADGFEPGRYYELLYRTSVCPVVGTGLLAIRECASFLRYGSAAEGNPCAGEIERAHAFGVSQSGRFLRTYLYHGLNLDEAGRQAYDGLLIHVAGARRGEFNHRFAQPSVQHTRGFGHLMPFAGDEQTDPITGRRDGLLSRQRGRGGMPRVFSTNSSAEYWRGDCSLIHTDLTGTRDVAPPSEERIYHFASTQHGAGALPLHRVNPNDGSAGVNDFNLLDYSPLLRAALEHLDRWVATGEEPPPSCFPRIADGTAVPMTAALAPFRRILGATVPDPDRLPNIRRVDLGPEAGQGVGRFPATLGDVYPCLVPAVDADGNDVAGLRLPEQAVPLATFAGWNPRDPATGGEGLIIPMQGSTLPFAATRADRERAGDPRPSVEERYRDREDYLARVRAEADRLVAARYLLADDVSIVLDNASILWSALAAGAPVPA